MPPHCDTRDGPAVTAARRAIGGKCEFRPDLGTRDHEKRAERSI
jgi:hypothetical protein